MLSHVELVLSLYLGLSGAVSSLDLGLAPSTHASARDQAAGLEIAGSFAVGSAARAHVEGAVVQLTFAAPVAKFLPMAAAAAAVLPEHTMRIHAEITEPDGALRSVMGPLAGFRNYGNLDVETVDGLLTFVRICSTRARRGCVRSGCRPTHDPSAPDPLECFVEPDPAISQTVALIRASTARLPHDVASR